MPAALEDRLLATTDGNPFFLHEQVRSLLDAGALERSDGRARFVGRSNLRLPPTIERALVARIDRLAETDRGALLAAAVLGPRFPESMVTELTGHDAHESLCELEQASFITAVPSLRDDESWYRFEHALVQEAAHGTLPRRQRRELHRRAAAVLEIAYAGRQDEIAAVLGRHLAEAGDSTRAVEHLHIAARIAASTYSNEEAVAEARSALELIVGFPDAITEVDGAIAIDLLRIDASASKALAKYAEAIEAYRLVIQLLPVDAEVERARVHREIGEVMNLGHRYDEALAELDRAALLIGDRHEDPASFAVWLDIQMGRCNVYYWIGDLDHYTRLLEHVEPVISAHATPTADDGVLQPGALVPAAQARVGGLRRVAPTRPYAVRGRSRGRERRGPRLGLVHARIHRPVASRPR